MVPPIASCSSATMQYMKHAAIKSHCCWKLLLLLVLGSSKELSRGPTVPLCIRQTVCVVYSQCMSCQAYSVAAW